jgi:xanthine/uracil permease
MRWRPFLERAFPPFSDRKREKPREMLYIAAERPGWPLAIVGGAQHALIALMLVIYTVIVGKALEIPEAQLRGFVSLEIVVMGLITLLQSMATRLSAGHLVVHIPSTMSMAGFITVASTFGLEAAAGGLLLAGVAVFLLSRFLARLQMFFPPEVSGVLLVLLGLTLVQSGVTRFTGLERGHIDPTALVIATTTLGSIIAVSVWTPSRLRVFAVAIGAGAGLLVAVSTGQFGAEQLHRVAELPALAFPLGAYRPPTPTLVLAAALPLLLIQIISGVDSIGAGVAIDKINNGKWRRADMTMISRLVSANSLGVILNGLTGTPAIGTSSANIGLAHATGVAARRVGTITGILLVTLAFLPQVAAFVISIPQPVVGAIIVYTAGYMMVSGMELILSRLLNSRRMFMVGVSITAGASIMLVPDLTLELPKDLKPILGSGLMLGAITAIGLTVFFRIGISRRGEVELAGAHSGQEATNFLEDCGASWGARRDVVARAGVAIGEALEALYGAGLVEGPITLRASFDEYKLLLDLDYPGSAISFAADQQIDLEALLEDDDEDAALDAAMSGMSGNLIKHMADRVTSSETAGRALLRLLFNH